jgi:hypothetical protein
MVKHRITQRTLLQKKGTLFPYYTVKTDGGQQVNFFFNFLMSFFMIKKKFHKRLGERIVEGCNSS